MTLEELIETKNEILKLRMEILVNDHDGLPPIANECVLDAVAHLTLAENALAKAKLWTIHARTTK